jgi:ABC-type sugar transport system ATPase subunit
MVAMPMQPAERATAPLLRVEGLSVRYEGFTALDALDLDIKRGETVALAGENGAGKSTLVRCIGGDVAASSGQVYIDGERVGSTPAAAANAHH